MEWSELSLVSKIIAVGVTALAIGGTAYVFFWDRVFPRKP
jgi:hypothetical protein